MKTATVYPQTPEQTSLPAYLQAAKQPSSWPGQCACNAPVSVKEGALWCRGGHKKPGQARSKCRYCVCNTWHSITDVMLSEMLQAEGGT
jgi:hypothetical protein